MRLFALLGMFALVSCGGPSPSADGNETTERETKVAPPTTASNENFARLIMAGGVPERCINLGSWAGERTPKEKAMAGLMEFNADPYVNPAPAWIAELANAGFLSHEGEAVTNNNPVNVYRATAGNEGMFRWVESDGNRGGSIHFCPGVLDVEVVSYTEPAEERGMTQVQYRYYVGDVPAPIQLMMARREIPSGPPQYNEIRGTLLVGGEGTVTLVKTNNGWELSQQRY
jgi:hypothetical protein